MLSRDRNYVLVQYYYGIPSVQKFALSVRLSVRHHFVSALYHEYFSTDFLQTLYKS